MKHITCSLTFLGAILFATACNTGKYYPLHFDNRDEFVVNGYYRIVDKKERIGYADSLGNIAIKPTFAFGLPFNPAGQARVTNTGKRTLKGEHWLWESDDWFYIDTAGNRVDENDIAVFDCVESMPKFPGGDVALMKFISKNLALSAGCNQLKGTIIAEFDVTEEGKVENVKIIRSAGTELDNEFVRVIKSFPDFIPGKTNGYPVRCRYVIPLRIHSQ